MTTSNDKQARITAARESFSGRTLTETQFREAWAVSGILNAEIHKTGAFREKLTDYAHAYARSERFDALRGEVVLRDIYAGRYGQTLNQTREGLKAAQDNLPDMAKTRALDCAESIGGLIQAAPTQPFYQAYDRAAVTLSAEFGITQIGAKELMKDVFEQHYSKELYAHGKQIEDQFHRPMREAQMAARKQEKPPLRSQSQSYS